jgi:hypothetical protein
MIAPGRGSTWLEGHRLATRRRLKLQGGRGLDELPGEAGLRERLERLHLHHPNHRHRDAPADRSEDRMLGNLKTSFKTRFLKPIPPQICQLILF